MTFYCRQKRFSISRDPEEITWHKVIWEPTQEIHAGINNKTVCSRSLGNFAHFQAEEPRLPDPHCSICFPVEIIDSSEPIVQHHRVRSQRPDGTEMVPEYKLDVKPWPDVVRAEAQVVGRLMASVDVFRKDPSEDDRCENEKFQDSRGLILDMVEALPSLEREELRRLAWQALMISDGPTNVFEKAALTEYLRNRSQSPFFVSRTARGEFTIRGKEGWTT